MLFTPKRGTLITLCLITILIFSVTSTAFTTNTAQAQEATPELTPTPEVTAEAPPATEPAQEVTPDATPSPEPSPTETPTAEVTPEATATVTETAAPTEVTVTATPVYPPVISPFSDDFQDGDTLGWLLSDAWILASQDANIALSNTLPDATAAIAGMNWQDILLIARVYVQPNSVASVNIRSSAVDGYTATIDYNGTAQLLRGGVVIAQAATPTVDPNPSTETPLPVWHSIVLRALGTEITVIVDGVAQFTYNETQPLGAGGISFGFSVANMALDDVRVEDLSIPPATVTATPEGTVEATAEATPESTEPVVPTLAPEIAAKLEAALVELLNAQLAGADSPTIAQLAQTLGVTIDENGRIQVVVSTGADTDVATLTALIEQLGGEIVSSDDSSVTAWLTLAQLLPLVNTPQVGTVTLALAAESTPEATAEATQDFGALADGGIGALAEAATTGVYDDTSVSAVYSTNWTPQYNAISYNNTLHFTSGNNETVQFFFTGDGFTIRLLGNTMGGAFEVSLDADGDGVAQTLLPLNAANRVMYGAGFTCSAEISTVNGQVTNVRNPNVFYTIGCRGISANFSAVDHMLQIRNVGTGQLYVDSFEVLGVSGVGAAGYFENTDTFRLNFSVGWLHNAGGRGGTTSYSNSTTQFVAFDINVAEVTAGEGFILYHAAATAGYKVCVTLTSVAPSSCTSGTTYSTLGAAGRRFFTEADLGLTTVTGARRIVISSAGGAYFGLDALFIVGSPNGLDTLTLAGAADGLYEDYDANIRRIGAWTSLSVPQAVGGSFSYTNDANGSMLFNVDAATQGIAIYTTNAAAYGTFELCIYTQTSNAAHDDVCQPFNTVATSTTYGRVNVVRLPADIASSARLVEIRKTSAGFVAIEAIRLLGAIAPLDNGNYDDAQTLDLNFSGGWIPVAGGRNNTLSFSNNSSHFVWFDMNFTAGNQGEGIVIYNGAGYATGGVNVCVTDTTTSPTACATNTYTVGTGTRHWLSETDLGITVAGQTGARRIIISPSGTNWFTFDGVLLVGPNNTIGTPLNLAAGDPTGFYEPDEGAVFKAGTWTTAAQADALGGDTYYATGINNALLFNVDSATQGIAIYTTKNAVYGTGEVCVYSATDNAANDDVCTTFNTAGTGTGIFIVRIPTGTTTTPAGASRIVEIRITSAAYISVQGFRLLGAVTPLADGYYEDSQVADLNYSSTGWVPVASGRGGSSQWTNSAALNTFVWFDMTFNAAEEGEGLILYNVPGYPTAGINVCIATAGVAAPTNGCTAPTYTTPFGATTAQWITETDLTANDDTGAVRIIISPAAAPAGPWFGFDGITLVGQNNTIGTPLTLAGGSPAGFYEPENSSILKVGTWNESAAPAALGGDVHFATGVGQAMLFNVDSATRGVAVYTTNAPGYATGEVCVYNATTNTDTDAACTPFNTNVAAGQGVFFVRIPAATTTAPVGASRLVEIRITSAAYLGIQGVRLLGGVSPLAYGYYEDSQTSDLNYSGTGWLAVASGRGNISHWTNSAATSTFVSFEMNFTTANDGEGIIIYNASGYPAAGVNVCVDTNVGVIPTNGCTVPTTTYTFGANTRRWLSETDLGVDGDNGTVRVILSPSSAVAGQWFGFDGITLVGQNVTTPLTLAGGSPTSFYEPENANVLRVGSWVEAVSAGALGGDFHYLNSAGQSMLFSVDSATQGVAIYTTNGSTYATGELCVYNATNSAANDDTCVTFTTNGAAGTGVQFVRIPTGTTTTPAGASRLVEVRTTSVGIMAIQGFRLVGAQTALAAGYYQATEVATNFNLVYSGTWLVANTTAGNPVRWANSTASNASFLWNVAAGRNDRLIIYRSTAAGLGNIEVCIAAACTTVPNIASNGLAVPSNFITKANLGLDDLASGDFVVTIRPATATFIGLEGIQVLADSAPLVPGNYEETLASTNYNLNYSATGWTPITTQGRGMNGMWTNSAASSTFAWFEVTFDAAEEGEGLLIYNAAGYVSGGVNVCVVAAGGAAPANGCTVPTPPSSGYLFGTNTRRFLSETDLGVTAVTGARRIILSPSSTAGSGQWFGFEGLFVLGQPNNVGTPLTLAGGDPTSFYEPDSLGVTRIGNWVEAASAGALGGDFHWLTSDRQSMLMNVDSATRGIAVYTTNLAGSGSIEVCIYSATSNGTNDDTCSTFSTASTDLTTGINVVRIPTGTTTTPAGSARLIEIRTTSPAAVRIQGFRLLSNAVPLTAGFYQSNDANVTFSANWTTTTGAAYEGGSVQYTNSPTAQMTFSIGGTGGETTGFVLHVTRATFASPMVVCYDRVSDPADDNLTPALGVGTCEQITLNNAVTQNVYGVGFYGLPSRTLTNSGAETYNISVKHTGPGTQYLFVDAINVLAAPTASLVAGTNDNGSSAILYSPTSRWTTGSTSITTLAGGIAQTRFTGNSLIIYGSNSATGSTGIQFCLIAPNITAPASRLQCGTFSQNGVASYTPTIFYGLGSGQHDVVFDNRTPGSTFTIDSLVPR